MLREFAQLVAELFPSLDSRNTREYLNQLRREPVSWLDLYATQIPPEVTQGDIVDPVSFIVEEQDGSLAELVAPGMILSHSCDIENDDYIIVAPCRPFSYFQQHRSAGDIKNNTFLSVFYLESVPTLGDRVVDLSVMQSIRMKTLKSSLQNGTVRRVSSFTMLGYYFLVAKLTVRFLRPQPLDEVRGMSGPGFGQRAKQVGRDLRHLARYLISGSNIH